MSLIHEVKDLFKKRSGLTSIHHSWEEVELKDVFRLQNGAPFKSSLFNTEGEGIPLIRIRDIMSSSSKTFYTGEYTDDFVVKKDDLLVGMDGDFHRNLWQGEDSLLNQRVCRLVPKTDILIQKLVYYGLPGYLKTINDNTSATTVKHLSSKSIGEIPFPLPPLPEQQRIVAKLDHLFGHLEQVKTRLEKIPTLLKNFRQAILTQAVTGKLTEEWRVGKELGEWEGKRIDEIAILLSGFAFKSKDFTPKGIQLIRMGNLYKNKLSLDRNPVFLPKSIDSKLKEKYLVKKGDILLSLTGTKYKRDYGFAIEINKDEELLLNQRILGLTPNINSKFLLYLLRGNGFRDAFFEFETGGVNQGNVGVRNIASIIQQIPPKEEQTEIVKRVESLFAKADAIEAKYNALKAQIDSLPQAILAKAFKGELVPQLESDGSAEELLKEIQKLKEEAKGKKKVKKKSKPKVV